MDFLHHACTEANATIAIKNVELRYESGREKTQHIPRNIVVHGILLVPGRR